MVSETVFGYLIFVYKIIVSVLVKFVQLVIWIYRVLILIDCSLFVFVFVLFFNIEQTKIHKLLWN